MNKLASPDLMQVHMNGMQRVWSAQSDAVGCSQTQLMRSDRKLTQSDAVGRGRTWSDMVGRS